MRVSVKVHEPSTNRLPCNHLAQSVVGEAEKACGGRVIDQFCILTFLAHLIIIIIIITKRS
jgi:hypothetical protein